MNNKQIIRKFIEENAMEYNKEIILMDDDDFFEIGFVDSLFTIKLINFLESRFEITFDLVDIDLENFNTVNRIVNTIEKRLSYK